MTNPTLSIITVVYNGQKHIEECLKNVIDQNCPTAEHIVIDGASTDRTMAIVENLARRHPHIRWASEKDKGQSDAMNKGIAMARGKIIGFLNCDDHYEPGTLRRVEEIFLTLPEPSLVAGNCRIVNDDGELIGFNTPRDLTLMGVLLDWDLNPMPCNPSAYFYHKSIHARVGLFSVDEHYAMDLEFLYKALGAVHTKHVDEHWGNWKFIKGSKTYEAKLRGEMDTNCRRVRTQCLRSLPFYHPAKSGILRWIATRWTYYTRDPGKLSERFQKVAKS